MTGLLAVAGRTVRQVLPTKRLVGFGLLELAAVGVFVLSSLDRTPARVGEIEVTIVLTVFFPLVVPIVGLVLGAAALGDERRDRTLPFLVLRPLPRIGIAGAKLVGAAGAAVGLNLLGATGISLAAAAMGSTGPGPVPLVTGTILATVAYLAIFVPLGFLVERAVLAGLTFVFVFENGIAGALPGVAGLSAWRRGAAAYLDLAGEGWAKVIPEAVVGGLHGGVLGTTLEIAAAAAVGVLAVAAALRYRDLA